MDNQLIDEMEQVLRVLGNGTRLRLLLALQRPRRLSEIRLETDGRPISRQAVQKHLNGLEDIGLVQRLDDPPGAYVVRHARMYEIVERLRGLATLKAAVQLEDVTRQLTDNAAPVRPGAAHLVTIRGVREGETFVLDAPDEEGGWTLGRTARFALDHDQFASGRHARILRHKDQFFILDLAANRNGTTLNWRPMEKGGLAPLAAGDIIGIGMTRLVFRKATGRDRSISSQERATLLAARPT